MHKRKKLKGEVEMGVVLALIKHEDVTTGSQQVLPKKFRDLDIFSIPCTIGNCTFADAMMDLGASINVMPSSIYKSLNFSDLKPMRMIIYVMQPLGILEDVLIQDEAFGKGSTLILGRLFLMIARTKIDVHPGTISMEFGDNLV
ncbi:hypothetical protein CR513_15181, partial [Mucuna pruriens]